MSIHIKIVVTDSEDAVSIFEADEPGMPAAYRLGALLGYAVNAVDPFIAAPGSLLDGFMSTYERRLDDGA